MVVNRTLLNFPPIGMPGDPPHRRAAVTPWTLRSSFHLLTSIILDTHSFMGSTAYVHMAYVNAGASFTYVNHDDCVQDESRLLL
jgi:hypothetical protein